MQLWWVGKPNDDTCAEGVELWGRSVRYGDGEGYIVESGG